MTKRFRKTKRNTQLMLELIREVRSRLLTESLVKDHGFCDILKYQLFGFDATVRSTLYNQLLKHKPPSKDEYGYWWPLTEYGYRQRKAALKFVEQQWQN